MKTTVTVKKLPVADETIKVHQMEDGQFGIIVDDTIGGCYRDLMVVRLPGDILMCITDVCLSWSWKNSACGPPGFMIQPIKNMEIGYHE